MTTEPESLIESAPEPTPPPNFFSATPAGRRTPSTSSRMSDQEKKRFDLQMRVWNARMQIPSHIPFRVFKEPRECTEWALVLNEREPVSLMD